MAANEIGIYLCDKKYEVFLYDSFFDKAFTPSAPHSHRHAEIHLTTRGETEIITQDARYKSPVGTVTVIPKETEHRLTVNADGTRHRAFSITYPAKEICQKRLSAAFSDELERAFTQEGAEGAYAYITLICQSVLGIKTNMLPVDNREFTIYDFFATRYNTDVCIQDLADELKLCPKQTARLVKKYMGAHFSTVLTNHRICAAKSLISGDSSLSLSEIARLVGYNTYSGFWKAFKANSELPPTNDRAKLLQR